MQHISSAPQTKEPREFLLVFHTLKRLYALHSAPSALTRLGGGMQHALSLFKKKKKIPTLATFNQKKLTALNGPDFMGQRPNKRSVNNLSSECLHIFPCKSIYSGVKL